MVPAEELAAKEIRFLSLWKRMLRKANFQHITLQEYEFAMRENFLNSIPIEIQFNRIDPTVASTFATDLMLLAVACAAGQAQGGEGTQAGA